MLEDGVTGTPAVDVSPRATLILPPGVRDNSAAIWMGGARSLGGHHVALNRMRTAWLVETAGDMPAAFHEMARNTLFCVFADTEEVPSVIDRIRDTAVRVADAARLQASAPTDVYIVCSQGLNRSGLVTGLVLRQLGMAGSAAVDLIRSARPGALSNHAFEGLVLGETAL